MKSTFGPWHHPIEASQQNVLSIVARVARERDVPFMLFGAFARELHFYHQHGIVCDRRTRDVDFSIQVADWAAYNAFRKALGAHGFRTENPEHPEKLIHAETGQEIDLLPFGEIAVENDEIVWPSDNSPWSVLGFEEAFEHTWTFEMEGQSIRVVSIPMLVALKIVAVMDREIVRHKKDGTDISFILEHYLEAGNRHRLLEGEDADLLDLCDKDLDTATAGLLGRDLARTLRPKTRGRIQDYLQIQTDSSGRVYLVRGLMTSSRHPTFPKARACLQNILTGMESVG